MTSGEQEHEHSPRFGGDEHDKPKRTTGVRWANGILSACIGVFFLVHSLVGSASRVFGFTSVLKVLAWAGVAAVAVHVVLCAVASYQMMTDKERPPSDKKKRHMLLKWVTGAAVLIAAAVHFTFLGTGNGQGELQVSGIVLALALLVLLASHICIGAKSLLKDLNISRSYRPVLRASVIVLAAVSGVMMLVALVFASTA